MDIWSDVAHSPAMAQEAIAELERVASHLDGLTQARATLGRQATVGWHGALREDYEQTLAELLDRSEDVIDRLRRTADRIAEETELAALEQRRRERLRQPLGTSTLSVQP